MDVDWPQYAYKNTTTGQLVGIGKDIADGVTALCDNLTIESVEPSQLTVPRMLARHTAMAGDSVTPWQTDSRSFLCGSLHGTLRKCMLFLKLRRAPLFAGSGRAANTEAPNLLQRH